MEKHFSPLIDAQEVSLMLDDPHVVVVDARGGPGAFEQYGKGHLQGAVYIDLENDLSQRKSDPAQGGRHPLPDPAYFGSILGKLGIRPSTHIVVYDDKNGANAAARFWWMLKAAGHLKVQVVNGGYAAIVKSGLPLNQTIPRNNSANIYPFSGWKMPTVDIETVGRKRSDPRSVVIDVREEYRYRGESEPIDLIAGHIPGALNLPYLDNLETDGCFKPGALLATQFRKIIGDRDINNVIVHCGSGVTACHTLLAMEHAGMPGASLYVGSWSEWSRNEMPVATDATGS